jgi:hypothetical protein
MSFARRVLSLFSAQAEVTPPAGVRTIPCTGIDLGARDIVITTGFIIDARLDAKRLEETLSTIIDRKFPRAGARLALRNGVCLFLKKVDWVTEAFALGLRIPDPL